MCPQEPHLRFCNGLHHQRHVNRCQSDVAKWHGVAPRTVNPGWSDLCWYCTLLLNKHRTIKPKNTFPFLYCTVCDWRKQQWRMSSIISLKATCKGSSPDTIQCNNIPCPSALWFSHSPRRIDLSLYFISIQSVSDGMMRSTVIGSLANRTTTGCLASRLCAWESVHIHLKAIVHPKNFHTLL